MQIRINLAFNPCRSMERTWGTLATELKDQAPWLCWLSRKARNIDMIKKGAAFVFWNEGMALIIALIYN